MEASNGRRLFLSHSSHDKRFVDELVVRLREAGISEPWYDTFDIDAATEDVPAALREGVASADWFALVLSPHSAESQWVSYEAQAAQDGKAKVLVLLHDSPQGHLPYLENPFIGELLRGGRRKILDFTVDYESALIELLLVVAPEIGQAYEASMTLEKIVEGDDPDVAERAMSHAALYPERLLPPLLERLPTLRNSRKTRLRVEGAFAAIGRPAIEPLLDFVFRVRRPADATRIPPPNIAPDSVDESGLETYQGASVIDLLRYSILTGGDQAWAASIGAEYGLVAVARRDRALRRSVVDELQAELRRAASIISSGGGVVVDEFLDVLRIAIETLGLAAEPGEIDDFLVHEFATTALWDWDTRTIKSKLAGYVADCLARSGSKKALGYLTQMLRDDEIVDVFFDRSRASNPWEHAFVPFGAAAVDRLLELRDQVDPAVLPILHLNLAQIPHPRGSRAALDWATTEEKSALMATGILLDIANAGFPAACDELVSHYWAGDFGRLVSSQFGDRVIGAAVMAARHGTDPAAGAEVCAGVIDDDDVALRIELARTIPAIGAFDLYARVIEWLDHPSPYVRGAAAISLSEHRVLKSPDKLLHELEYADDELKARIGVALSYFGHEAAVEPLAQGLRLSLLAYDDPAHEMYNQALERIDSPAAREASTAWYRRI